MFQYDKLLWKIDRKIISFAFIWLFFSYLDRTNLGNAKVNGLEKSLRLTNGQYQIALSMFFVSYSLIEPFCNVLLRKLRPIFWIPGIVTLWGFCELGMGFVYNFPGLLVARLFLGLCEGGLFPGVSYFITCWYKRRELGVRIAFFYSAAPISGAFGGLLAAGISHINDGHRPGWTYIFIIEGVLTIILGLVSFKYVPDFPDEATFLTVTERKDARARIAADHPVRDIPQKYHGNYVRQAFGDWKTLFACLLQIGVDGPVYGFSLWLPSIVRGLAIGSNSTNLTSTQVQLLTVPPYCFGAACVILIGFVSDRTGERGICNMVAASSGIIGFAILIATENNIARYVALFFVAAGIFSAVSNTMTWVSNNTEGVYKRAIVLGTVLGCGNLNGLVSSNIFPNEDLPRYHKGMCILLGYEILVFITSFLYRMYLKGQNKKKAARRGSPPHNTLQLTDVDKHGDISGVLDVEGHQRIYHHSDAASDYAVEDVNDVGDERDDFEHQL